jgi:type I restriction enzyme S subunit
MRKGRGEAGETVTGGRAATVRHVFGERVLSICMPNGKDHPKGWRWVALSDVAQMESGHTPSRNHPEYWGGDIPWISVKDARLAHGKRLSETEEYTNSLGIANSSARLLPEGTVCLSRGGTVGYVVILDKPMATSQGFANWICGPQLVPQFLQYLLLAEAESLEKFSIGTTIKTIYYPDLKAFHICLPPLAEQKRIVALLDEAFARIDEAKAKAEACLAGSKSLIDCHLRAVFCEQTNGWEKSTIGAEMRFIDYRGKTPAKTASGIRLITAKNVKMGHLQDTPMEFIAAKDYDKWMTRGIPRKGDVLFTTEAPLANVAQLDTDEKVAFAQRVIILQPNANRLNSSFLKYLLISQPVQERIRAKGTGATVQGIKASLLKLIEISFPQKLTTQEEVVAKMDTLLVQARNLTKVHVQRIEALNELKKSILTQAFAGELTA